MTASNLPNYDVVEVQFDDDDEFVAGTIANTMTFRLPPVEVRPEWIETKATDMARQSRIAHSRPGYRGTRSGGSTEIDTNLPGHLADTASGALTPNWFETLLGHGLGGLNADAVGGLAGASATTTALPNGTGTRVRGGIVVVGTKGDTKGDGQPAVMGAGTALLTALPAAPGASDVVRATVMVYPGETLGELKRFLIGWSRTGEQYVDHGCQLEKVTFRTVVGSVPSATLRYLKQYWERVSGVTIPSAMTEEKCDAVMTSSAGSVYLQNVGTTTRATVDAVEMEITLNTALAAHNGQGGVSGRQSITGWSRMKAGGPDTPFGTIRLRIPKEQALELEYANDGSNAILKHILIALSVGEGTANTEGCHVTFYAPSAYYIGQGPVPVNHNGILYEDVFFALQEGPDITNELTRSALRIGFH